MGTNNFCDGGPNNEGCGASGGLEDPFNQDKPEDSSPIVLDLDRDGFSFTGPEDPVDFDIDGDNVAESLTWTAGSSGDGFLALDRNGDGTIDSGAELFGNHTVQPETDDPNGFLALAVFDRAEEGGNGDGWMSVEDAVYSQLQVWVDESHDGVSEAGELMSLEAAGVVAIDLNYHVSNRRDRHGNRLHWISFVRFTDGQRRLAAVDVIFRRLPQRD